MEVQASPSSDTPRLPVCVRCGGVMHLARIEPAYVATEGWCEAWNFDCSCGNVFTATKSSGAR